METIVQSIDGKEKRHFKKGETIKLLVSDLLAILDMDLDDRNTNSGGDTPAEGMDWPLYRMTGKAPNVLY